MGGTAIDADHSYLNILFSYSPGDQLTLDLYRNGRQIQVQVTRGVADSN